MKNKVNYNQELIDEYTLTSTEDDDTTLKIKQAISKYLSPIELKIFLYYCELKSYAAVAREFNVSPPTVRTYLLKIKDKIKYIIEC